MHNLIKSNLIKFWKLPLKDKSLFLEALFMVLIAKIFITLIPFRICIKTIIKQDTNILPVVEILYRIKYAIGRTGKLAFWYNACLVQSFAARWMLQRRGISSTLFIGVKHGDKNNIIAHAWVTSDDVEIVPGDDQFTTLASY